MLKSKWGAYAFGIVMAMGFVTVGNALAAASSIGIEDESAKEVQADVGQTSPAQPVAACSSINLRSAQLHVKCTTSTGAVYERVSRDSFGEAWKGPDGLIWSDVVVSANQYDAMNTCKKLGGSLPEQADFKRGEANGFREVLPNIKERWFWSSSITPDSDEQAYFFDGDDGDFDYFFRGNYEFVRCVGR